MTNSKTKKNIVYEALKKRIIINSLNRGNLSMKGFFQRR